MNQTVSLLITTFNRGHLLEKTLPRIKQLVTPDEIIIVDDGSSDNTQQIVEQMRNVLACQIKYVYLHRPSWENCAKARNIGLRMSSCDIIMGQEAEILQLSPAVSMFKDLLLKFPSHFINAANIYFQGVHQQLDDRFFQHPDLIWMSPYKEITRDFPTNASMNDIGFTHAVCWIAPFMYAVQRKHLLTIKGWREDFKGWGSEDTDLVTRLGAVGVTQFQNTDISAVHLWHDRAPQVAMQFADHNVKLMQDADYSNHPENVAVSHDNWGKLTDEDIEWNKRKGVNIDELRSRYNI